MRPIDSDDKDRLAAGVAALSPESAYGRFLTGKSSLTPAELRYLTEVDGVDHIALVVIDANGDFIAVGRIVRHQDRALCAAGKECSEPTGTHPVAGEHNQGRLCSGRVLSDLLHEVTLKDTRAFDDSAGLRGRCSRAAQNLGKKPGRTPRQPVAVARQDLKNMQLRRQRTGHLQCPAKHRPRIVILAQRDQEASLGSGAGGAGRVRRRMVSRRWLDHQGDTPSGRGEAACGSSGCRMRRG